MSLLRNLLDGPEPRSLSYQDIYGQALDLSSSFNTNAGVLVNEHRALQSLTVWGCVSLIADALASLPLDVYRKVKGVRSLIDPSPSLIADPYPKEMGSYDWMHRILVSMLLRGNAFVWLTRNQVGDIVEMIPLHPDAVSLNRQSFVTNDLQWFVAGQQVPRDNMLHIPYFTVPGFPLGLNPIEYLRHQIGGELAATEFGNRWFANNGVPSGILTTDQTLDNTAAEATEGRWKRRLGGTRKHSTAVLTGGWKYQAISVTAEESQFLETLKFKSHDIAGKLYRVPPHMIGDVERSTSWGTGIEQQSIGFVNYTLAPAAVRVERALSGLLPRPQYVKFNFDALLRGDMASRAAFYASGITNSWLNPDEAREKEDLPPIPDGLGQDFFYSVNSQILGSEPAAPSVTQPSDPIPVGDAPMPPLMPPFSTNGASRG